MTAKFVNVFQFFHVAATKRYVFLNVLSLKAYQTNYMEISSFTVKIKVLHLDWR